MSRLSLFLYQKTLVPLAIIAISAISLSIITYYYSSSTIDVISEVASDDIRSNAQSQAHDLSLILTNGLDSITTNLQLLSKSPAIQNGDPDARIIFDVAQNSTGELTQFYMWLDHEGRIVWRSNISAGELQSFIGQDRSSRPYFSVPKNTLQPNFGNLLITSDDARLYISYPIVDQREIESMVNDRDTGEFRGVVVAGIGIDIISNLLRQQSSDSERNSILLLDNEGTVLHARDAAILGNNILSNNIVSGLEDSEKSVLVDVLHQTSVGSSYSADFVSDAGRLNTIAAEPIVINGEHIWTIYIKTPHLLTDNVRELFDQQNIFSTIVVIIIGALAFGIAFFILIWNKRLGLMVDVRTVELKQANNSLAESNRKLLSLNDQLLDVNEQLKVHDRLQREFINIASHEIKTPTQAILLHSDILKNKLRSDNEPIEAIVRNAERLQRLTNNILDVTRIESQTLKLSKERFNLRDIISDIVEESKRQIKDRNLKIVYAPQDIIVDADKNRLIQVISNLLGNAIAFTKQGAISISTEWKDNEVHVKISDSGSGIDPEILTRLFSKFATKSDKGTGLGLFISKNIIKAHGGKIWAKNNSDGKGATFTFTVPAIKME